VSALIHAATMVTAGVYLVCRTSFIFALSPIAMAVVAGIGALTALFAASIAFTQNDLKKVLAYSTVSQLGFMFIGVGVGAFAAGFFHVITHAFFKGCLFLCAGSVIHAMHARVHDDDASQDMRNMGGLRKYMPITHATFLISCLAIAGFPGLSGFWSKDELLFKAFSNKIVPINPNVITPPEWYGQMIYVVGVVAAVGTAFYMFRAYFMTFHGDFRGWIISHGIKRSRGDDHAHAGDEALEGPAPQESPPSMTVPLVILAFFATIGGFVYAEPLYHLTHIEGFASLAHFWSPVFATADKLVTTRDGSEAMMLPLLAVGAAASIGGITAAYLVYVKYAGEPAKAFVARASGLHRLVQDKWRIDELYDATVIGLIDAMGDTAAQFDRWIVDGVIAKLTAAVTKLTGHVLRLLHTGRVQVYAASMVLGTAAIGWFLFTPHADATVDARLIRRTQGQVSFEAAAGPGYRYRWHVAGESPPDVFVDERGYVLRFERCEQKTAIITVKNAFDLEASKSFTLCRESKPGCCQPGAASPKQDRQARLQGGVR
jgi:NADH-quinone oxidoreductase subunit L